MFIPTTMEEVKERGWDELDVILISGDTYIDSSYNGSAVIGHYLMKNGFRVGIIAQPDVNSEADITRLGEPKLFWSISAGSVDSMVANYTPTMKFRKDDDFTPGGENNRRPDRACIAYSNLIKKHINGKPIVLGGIEASLRRLTHFDAWSNSFRRSILLDSKADIITYGMAERSNLLLAQYLRDGRDWHTIRGICYVSNEAPENYVKVPSHEKILEFDDAYIKMFKSFYFNNEPEKAKGIAQPNENRFVIQNPPSKTYDSSLLDQIYEMDFENEVHPYYAAQGTVKAIDTIRNSITTHRGCYGECNFCAIAMMQGRTIVSRSEESILREAKRMAAKPGFDGVIRDVGGPTANMYGFDCPKKAKYGPCLDKRCLYPDVCSSLPVNHLKQINLLKKISAIPSVKHVFIASGIRYDLILKDTEHGREYLKYIIENGHISGQMKVAPEHVSDTVLDLMGKPGREPLLKFKQMFDEIKEETGMELFLTYYFIAAHPGCYERHMEEVLDFCTEHLRTIPEQVQIFTPTPSTISTMMYCTRRDWSNKKYIKSEQEPQMKQRQKDVILGLKNASASRDPGSYDPEKREFRDRNDYSDRPRRDFNRDGDGRGGYGDRRGSGDRDRRRGYRNDRPRRDFEDRPRREFNPENAEPWQIDAQNADVSVNGQQQEREQREFRERRGHSDRPRSNFRGDGERPPYRPRDGQRSEDYGRGGDRLRRDFGDRPRRDYGDRPRRDFQPSEGHEGQVPADGEQREFHDRKPYGGRSRGDYHRGGGRPRGDFRRDGDRPRREFGGDGEKREFKPREDGDRREFHDRKPYGGRPRRNFNRDGDRPYWPRDGQRSGEYSRGGGRPRGDFHRGVDRPRRQFDRKPRNNY